MKILHENYENLYSAYRITNKPILLVGPKHCGKKTAVKTLAEHEKITLLMNNVINNKEELIGFYEGNEYQETELYKAYKNGCMYYIDVLNNCNTNILNDLILIQKSKEYDFPNGKVIRGKNFRFLCSLDREDYDRIKKSLGKYFIVVEFKFDGELEKYLCKDSELYEFANDLRNTSKELNLGLDIDTRTMSLAGKAYGFDPTNYDNIISKIVQDIREDVLEQIAEYNKCNCEYNRFHDHFCREHLNEHTLTGVLLYHGILAPLYYGVKEVVNNKDKTPEKKIEKTRSRSMFDHHRH